MKKLLLDVTEIMDMLGVDAPGLASLIREQRLPAVNVDGEIKFHEPDLRRWLRDYADANTLCPDTDPETVEQAVAHSAERTRERQSRTPDAAQAARLLADAPPAEPAARPEDQQVLFDIDVLDDLIEQYEAGQAPAPPKPPRAQSKPAPPLPKQGPAAPGETPADLYAVAEDQAEAEARAIFLFDAFAIRFMLFEARIMIQRGAAGRSGVMDEIARVLNDLGIDVADFEQVKQSLIRNEGRWVRLAEVPSPFLDKVNILVAPDRRRAYLVASATDINTPISQMHVTEELTRKGIRSGIVHDVCRRVVQERLFGHLVIAAQGREPEPGRDAELTYHFNRDLTLTPEALDTGDVDHKKLNSVESVQAGAVLVTRRPPEEGLPGEDVLGRPIEGIHGKNIRIRDGRNTVLSDDGTQLFAERDGHVYMSGGAVHVEELYTVDGDVDYATGNIDFTGIVVVRGFVRQGFQINASGDIRILGGVEGSRLVTARGDISISLGVQGQNKAVLEAGGDVRAKYIAQARVQAAGDVVVRESIMHSTVSAGGCVLAQGPKGSIIGGAVRAQNTIQARFIGSEAHVKTSLILESLDPESHGPVRDVLSKQRAKVSHELGKCMAAIAKLKQIIELNPSDAGLLQSLKANAHKARGLTDILARLDQDMARFRARFGAAGSRFIRASATVYPQVLLNIEGRVLRVNDHFKAATFAVDRDDRIITV